MSRPKIIKYCINCNKEITRYGTKGVYCNNKCQRDCEWKHRKSQIEASQSCDSQRVSRRYLLENYGYTCQICKGTKWLDVTLPLVMDHIDGNSDNWSLTNLRMICPNCDALLPTYKSKNRGKGRWSRRQRYQEGKSY